ncbi:MAG: hypothetical protein VZR27_03620 [Acutalibacteraceae bacterium]|nr:hypothetical protein [Clostridia bacterium]MBQ2604833.1 hypothetical protein [Clostridia bacterium]MEE3449778.1 hypothetical protein [Acutalibacteraceae bacterium]
MGRQAYRDETGYQYVNQYVISNAKEGRTIRFDNAEHMDFTDLPLFSPVLGEMLGHGDVDTAEMMTQVNSIVLDWFNYYLKNEGTLNLKDLY